MITHHTQLLQALIDKFNLKSYLEIGVQNPANNFDKINVADKIGVDPEVPGSDFIEQCTSDYYFDGRDEVFDLIFIDGLHTKEQVKKDFENSLRCLSDNGFIVIHDCLPENEEGTKVPRETKVWWGDVYKFCMDIGQYPGLNHKTFDIDNGCMVVSKNSNNKAVLPLQNTSWENYKVRGRALMNVQDEVTI